MKGVLDQRTVTLLSLIAEDYPGTCLIQSLGLHMGHQKNLHNKPETEEATVGGDTRGVSLALMSLYGRY